MWFQAHLKNAEDRVSIPMTVLGGLQYCAPEPLGLLAPDE